MNLGKYSMGIGDRFGQQGKYQLMAFEEALKQGTAITPVWNKSNREHSIVHSEPADLRWEADESVRIRKWKKEYFVDADHINNANVSRFIESSDFFTLDVADFIGKPAASNEVDGFVAGFKKYLGTLSIPGIERSFEITRQTLRQIAENYLHAVREAAAIYHTIEAGKGKGNFIAEVSIDEVHTPQTPIELFFIMGALASEGVRFSTIAPKFTGRFNKGVDYAGDLDYFAVEFEQDLLVINFAVREFQLNPSLKLSVHSGSDKFSLYPLISRLIRQYNQGIHIKTAGTTWLEEITGLAMAGSDALDLAKRIYIKAFERRDELCAPYASVIDINPARLPAPATVNAWTGEKMAASLRHVPGNPDFNPDMRQLIHVGYKIAAEYSNVYLNAIQSHAELIGKQVYENLLDRHIKKIFLQE